MYDKKPTKRASKKCSRTESFIFRVTLNETFDIKVESENLIGARNILAEDLNNHTFQEMLIEDSSNALSNYDLKEHDREINIEPITTTYETKVDNCYYKLQSYLKEASKECYKDRGDNLVELNKIYDIDNLLFNCSDTSRGVKLLSVLSDKSLIKLIPFTKEEFQKYFVLKDSAEDADDPILYINYKNFEFNMSEIRSYFHDNYRYITSEVVEFLLDQGFNNFDLFDLNRMDEFTQLKLVSRYPLLLLNIEKASPSVQSRALKDAGYTDHDCELIGILSQYTTFDTDVLINFISEHAYFMARVNELLFGLIPYERSIGILRNYPQLISTALKVYSEYEIDLLDQIFALTSDQLNTFQLSTDRIVDILKFFIPPVPVQNKLLQAYGDELIDHIIDNNDDFNLNDVTCNAFSEQIEKLLLDKMLSDGEVCDSDFCLFQRSKSYDTQFRIICYQPSLIKAFNEVHTTILNRLSRIFEDINYSIPDIDWTICLDPDLQLYLVKDSPELFKLLRDPCIEVEQYLLEYSRSSSTSLINVSTQQDDLIDFYNSLIIK